MARVPGLGTINWTWLIAGMVFALFILPWLMNMWGRFT